MTIARCDIIATAQPEGERHGSVVIRVLDHLFVRRGGV